MNLASNPGRLSLLALIAAAALWAALPSPASAQQRYWYDGDHRRALWSDPANIADFSAGQEKSQVLKPAGTAKGGGAQSPVFRDGAGEKSRARALPGGIVIRFAAGSTPAQRDALFAKHALTPLREIGSGDGMWLVESPPGLDSLELANRLHESGDFAGAAPNWWQQRTLK